jgi:glutamate/tyrosine decarboxylase-like PLP-dependent enzyme
MMGMPLLCSATLMREKGRLAATNRMDADYLFHGAEGNSIDLGDMTLQCGRRVDALKLWFSWQALGDEGYEQRVDRLFVLAGWVRDEICTREDFRLVREPQATNVCFRYRPPGTTSEHEATVRIRERLVRSGRFLINYATLDGQATFRIVLSNPATTEQDLAALLDEIEVLGKEL